jgi:uncharacterized protein involved in outer membrane biogenesis
MKKKILLFIGIGLVAVIVIGVLVVGFFLGDLVKAGMETIGPKVTQTSLTVGSVQVGILTGSGGVKDLVLGNPDEYKAKTPNAITLGKAAVSVSPGSLLTDKIVIKSVEVRSPEIYFEGNPLTKNNNLQKIMDNVSAFTGGASAKPADTNAPAKGAAKPAKKLEVDDFLVTGAKVHFNGATLPLPDIHFSDLGKGPDGITAGDLTQKVLGEITTATLKAVVESVSNLGKGAADAAKDAGKTLGNEAGKIGKSLGGLFGK